MTPEHFVYWLQGFVELHGDVPTKDQWDSIRAHLGTVFNKVTPVFPSPAMYPSGYSPDGRRELMVTC